ncbi:RNase adapter RapZ, partial [Thermus scotoductus]
MRFLVLSGLSGAGKTTARGYLEDLGYFMVDNLPPSLWEALLQELSRRGVERAGVVLDARALAFFGDLERVLDQLKPTVVFLEA